jgi:hypothetical protein
MVIDAAWLPTTGAMPDAGVRDAPHFEQNAVSGAQALPHWGHSME